MIVNWLNHPSICCWFAFKSQLWDLNGFGPAACERPRKCCTCFLAGFDRSPLKVRRNDGAELVWTPVTAMGFFIEDATLLDIQVQIGSNITCGQP